MIVFHAVPRKRVFRSGVGAAKVAQVGGAFRSVVAARFQPVPVVQHLRMADRQLGTLRTGDEEIFPSRRVLPEVDDQRLAFVKADSLSVAIVAELRHDAELVGRCSGNILVDVDVARNLFVVFANPDGRSLQSADSAFELGVFDRFAPCLVKASAAHPVCADTGIVDFAQVDFRILNRPGERGVPRFIRALAHDVAVGIAHDELSPERLPVAAWIPDDRVAPPALRHDGGENVPRPFACVEEMGDVVCEILLCREGVRASRLEFVMRHCAVSPDVGDRAAVDIRLKNAEPGDVPLDVRNGLRVLEDFAEGDRRMVFRRVARFRHNPLRAFPAVVPADPGFKPGRVGDQAGAVLRFNFDAPPVARGGGEGSAGVGDAGRERAFDTPAVPDDARERRVRRHGEPVGPLGRADPLRRHAPTEKRRLVDAESRIQPVHLQAAHGVLFRGEQATARERAQQRPAEDRTNTTLHPGTPFLFFMPSCRSQTRRGRRTFRDRGSRGRRRSPVRPCRACRRIRVRPPGSTRYTG